MWTQYDLIQIVEIPKNGDSSSYAVRNLARMEYFEFDFMCKNILKKFFADHNFSSGDYVITHMNENSGDIVVVDAVCIYRVKPQGQFLEFKIPGDEWKNLVKDITEGTPIVKFDMKIDTIKRVHIPKIGFPEGQSEEPVEPEEVTE